ncbi:MAG: DUF72 domain-containing protein [Gammaproteobacteria bacterium]
MKETDSYVGTCGWQHPQWRRTFFPTGMSAEERLAYYASRLRAVELDASRSMPTAEQSALWRASVPDDFRFTVRAPRALTHKGHLRNPEQLLTALFRAIAPLEEQLGVILFELPTRWPRMTDRLASFLAALPGDRHYAFEFPDPDWHHQEVYDLLTRHGAAFCIHDGGGPAPPEALTASFVYARLGGPGAVPGERYGAAALRGWATRIANWQRKGYGVYTFFANVERGFAVKDACLLQSYLRGDAGCS